MLPLLLQHSFTSKGLGKADVLSLLKNSDKRLLKEAEKLSKDKRLIDEANTLIDRLRAGNTDSGISPHQLFGNIFELRSSYGTRVYYRTVDGVVEILGISNKATQERVLYLIKKIYD